MGMIRGLDVLNISFLNPPGTGTSTGSVGVLIDFLGPSRPLPANVRLVSCQLQRLRCCNMAHWHGVMCFFEKKVPQVRA